MQKLIEQVEEWAEEKGIMTKGTPAGQAAKTLEETVELMHGTLNNDACEIEDAIGDILVTLIIQCKMQNLHIETCLNTAWGQIRHRRGEMINGQFVKEEIV